MKFFDTDWSVVFRWLAVWEELSPAARRHYLLAAPSHAQPVSGTGYGAELATVIKSGLVEAGAPGRYRPVPDSVPFRALFAQLAKHPLFDSPPTRERIEEYTRKQYLREEIDPIQSSWVKPPWDSVAWPNKFLTQTDAPAWEKAYLSFVEVHGAQRPKWRLWKDPPPPPKRSWFATPGTFEAAQDLVRAALDSPAPLPLISLPTRLPERLRPFLEPALKACLRFLLLYPSLRTDTLDAVIGLCPTVVFHRNRPPAQDPTPRPCPELSGPAYWLEDMTRVLAEAATGECRLNRGGYGWQFFKVVADRFRQDFAPLPSWLQTQTDFPLRLANAVGGLIGFEFAKDHNGVGGQRRLQATPKGRRWLSATPAERLRELLLACQRHPSGQSDYDDNLELVPGKVRFGVKSPDDFDHLPWLNSIWRQAPADLCVPLNAFLEFHARANHPLANAVVPDAFRPHQAFRFGSGSRGLREENIEEFAHELLTGFFWSRLVPLGCVETGMLDDGEIGFRLSSVGRFLFGLSGELVYGRPAAEKAVVVQPNLEIVFLQPDLNAEIEFAPLAERCGKDVGTLFRLTRRQAIRAAAQGYSADAALETLTKHSSKPVPANVAVELRAWFGACRHLATRRSVLIEAPDRETALRVKRLLGERSALIGETLIEWRGAQLDPALRRKMADQGLFLETA